MTSGIQATGGVVRVGEGRGFVVAAEHHRLVVTAAHCLPQLPPAASVSFGEERTYADLLGPLDGSERNVWAECLFVDPVGDIAVLGSPDEQGLPDQSDDYYTLVSVTPPLQVGALETPVGTAAPAWLMQLDGRWTSCVVKHFGRAFMIENAVDGIHGGMSGSPILADDGSAIGVVVCSRGVGNALHTSGGPNPRLTHHLPGWLMRQLGLVYPQPGPARSERQLARPTSAAAKVERSRKRESRERS